MNDEIIDGKAKYAKAINDFITTKDKAISRKFEIAKLLSEIIKYNGNTQQMFTEGTVPGNWADLLEKNDIITDVSNNVHEYKLK